LAPKATALREMTRTDGHYAVQGHSRSPFSVPIESPYATSYYCIAVPFPRHRAELAKISLSTEGVAL